MDVHVPGIFAVQADVGLPEALKLTGAVQAPLPSSAALVPPVSMQHLVSALLHLSHAPAPPRQLQPIKSDD